MRNSARHFDAVSSQINMQFLYHGDENGLGLLSAARSSAIGHLEMKSARNPRAGGSSLRRQWMRCVCAGGVLGVGRLLTD